MTAETRDIGRLVPDLTTLAGQQLARGDGAITVRSRKSGMHITVWMRAATPLNSGGKTRWEPRTLDKAAFLFLRTNDRNRIGSFDVRKGVLKVAPNVDGKILSAAVAALHAACAHPHPQLEFFATVPCGRCGELLTDPESILRGYGPFCYGEATKSKHVPLRPAPAQTGLNQEVTA
jgi:hypothetical protein